MPLFSAKGTLEGKAEKSVYVIARSIPTRGERATFLTSYSDVAIRKRLAAKPFPGLA